MATELSNDDLDDLEVELAQVEQTLRLLADEQVDPDQAVVWLDQQPSVTELGVDSAPAEIEAPGSEADESLAPIVELPLRTPVD